MIKRRTNPRNPECSFVPEISRQIPPLYHRYSALHKGNLKVLHWKLGTFLTYQHDKILKLLNLKSYQWVYTFSCLSNCSWSRKYAMHLSHSNTIHPCSNTVSSSTISLKNGRLSVLDAVEVEGRGAVGWRFEWRLFSCRLKLANRPNALLHMPQTNMTVHLKSKSPNGESSSVLCFYSISEGHVTELRNKLDKFYNWTWTSKFTRYVIEQYFQAESLLVIYQSVGMAMHSALE